MTNSSKSEKSRGVLVFAFNSPDTNYVDIADRTSKLTQQFLKLPITLVTDTDSDPKFAYDNIIRTNMSGENFRTLFDKQQVWKNFDRHTAYQLSPYDETILIDTDYVIMDNSLLKLFETPFDYKLLHHNKDTNGASYEEMGNTSLPFVWATVVLFRKSTKASILFDMVRRVQNNYFYYTQLYNISAGNYRNDYAFAIANSVVNGYNLNEAQGIPWSLFTLEKQVQKITSRGSFLAVHMEDKALVVPKQNIHIMDKNYLLSENFALLVEELCA